MLCSGNLLQNCAFECYTTMWLPLLSYIDSYNCFFIMIRYVFLCCNFTVIIVTENAALSYSNRAHLHLRSASTIRHCICIHHWYLSTHLSAFPLCLAMHKLLTCALHELDFAISWSFLCFNPGIYYFLVGQHNPSPSMMMSSASTLIYLAPSVLFLFFCTTLERLTRKTSKTMEGNCCLS